jgi:hypothetical protein
LSECLGGADASATQLRKAVEEARSAQSGLEGTRETFRVQLEEARSSAKAEQTRLSGELTQVKLALEAAQRELADTKALVAKAEQDKETARKGQCAAGAAECGNDTHTRVRTQSTKRRWPRRARTWLSRPPSCPPRPRPSDRPWRARSRSASRSCAPASTRYAPADRRRRACRH